MDKETSRKPAQKDPVHRKPWAQPLLRWAGSKRSLLPNLLAASPATFGRYIEPFAGSACLFFALRPKIAILGDVNEQLIESYKTIKKHPRLVARKASQWPSDARTYYHVRDKEQDSELDPIAAAARFLYLNRHCFNGVYRINRKGRFNVPRGVRTGQLPSESHLYRCSMALRDARLIGGDFQETLSKVKQHDFVYLDPPYATAKRPTHGEYAYDSFSDEDIPRLIELLEHIDSVGATFLLSYSYARCKDFKLPHWYTRRIAVQRHVAGFAQHRRGVYELLVSNQPINMPREGAK